MLDQTVTFLLNAGSVHMISLYLLQDKLHCIITLTLPALLWSNCMYTSFLCCNQLRSLRSFPKTKCRQASSNLCRFKFPKAGIFVFVIILLFVYLSSLKCCIWVDQQGSSSVSIFRDLMSKKTG